MPSNLDFLRRRMQELPVPDGSDIWSQHRREIRKNVLNNDMRTLFAWSSIRATMFVDNGLVITECERKLREAGKYIKFRGARDAPNLVHKRYHWHIWEKNHTKKLSDANVIVEFGGGYGALAVVADRLGFRGQYYIIDFPELMLIQQYWLADKIKNCHIRYGKHPRDPDILVSTDGLSETDNDTRTEFMKGLEPATYLFSSCSSWDGINNRDWFQGWAQNYFRVGGPLYSIDKVPIIASHFYCVSHA